MSPFLFLCKSNGRPSKMALTLVTFLRRVLVGFVNQHLLSLTALFGDSIAIPPNAEIKDLRKAFNNQIQKRSQAKQKEVLKKIRFLCHRNFAVVSHPSTNSTQMGLTSVETCIKLYIIGYVNVKVIRQQTKS